MSESDMPPINSQSEICQILSCLPEKFVVDFANGIDVARDHIRIQNNRTGFTARLYDGFTGQGSRRQAEINSSLADGVEGTLVWLTELTNSVAHSNLALARVSERLASIQSAIARLANYSAETQTQIENLSQRIHSRMDHFSAQLVRVAAEQRAEQQLTRVFNKWAAGKFATFSSAARCYAALEELRWGAFGDFCRTTEDRIARNSFLEDLTNRALEQMRTDAGLTTATTRMPIDAWLTAPTTRETITDAPEALAYLGNWSIFDLQPFVYTVSQRPLELPLGLPRMCSAERISRAMVEEVFTQEKT